MGGGCNHLVNIFLDFPYLLCSEILCFPRVLNYYLKRLSP